MGISIIVCFIAGCVVTHVVMWLYDRKQRRKWTKWLEYREKVESRCVVMNPVKLVRKDGADSPLSKRMQFVEEHETPTPTPEFTNEEDLKRWLRDAKEKEMK